MSFPEWRNCETESLDFWKIVMLSQLRCKHIDSYILNVFVLLLNDSSQYIEDNHYFKLLIEHGHRDTATLAILITAIHNRNDTIQILNPDIFGEISDGELDEYPVVDYLHLVRTSKVIKLPLKKHKETLQRLISKSFNVNFVKSEKKFPDEYSESLQLLLRLVPDDLITDHCLKDFDEIVEMCGVIKEHLTKPINVFTSKVPPECLKPEVPLKDVYEYIYLISDPDFRMTYLKRCKHLEIYKELRRKIEEEAEKNFKENIGEIMYKYNKLPLRCYSLALPVAPETKEELEKYVKEKIIHRVKNLMIDVNCNKYKLANITVSSTDKWYMLHTFFVLEENNVAYIHCPEERKLGKNIYTGNKFPFIDHHKEHTINIQEYFENRLMLPLNFDPWPEVEHVEDLIKLL